MRSEYIEKAAQVVTSPPMLINLVSRRVKQLKFGSTPMVESLERLSPEDIALREIIEGKLTMETEEEEAQASA